MPDFMISLFTQSAWLAWLVFVLAVSGGMYWAIHAGILVGWLYRKARPCRCEECDPPEYQPDEEPPDDWPESDTEWLRTLAWGPEPPKAPQQDMADLAEVLMAAVDLGLLRAEDNPALITGQRCTDRDCDLFGFIHPPPCVLMPTQPAACYTDDRAPVIDMTGPLGPAGPPEPARPALEISDSQVMRRVDWETLAIAEQIRKLEAGNGTDR